MRNRQSCRFSPYYKLEWFDVSIFSWRPIQKSFATIDLAKAAQESEKAWRIIERSEKGTRVL